MADLLRQRQQAQAVGDGAAAFSQLFGGRFLRQAIFFNQLVAALSYLDGIQVLALQVFDQRQGCGLFRCPVFWVVQQWAAAGRFR